MIQALGLTKSYGRVRAVDRVSFTARPGRVVLDEPANGLDPEGVAWIRLLLRNHANRGGTVLLSSHLLAELAQLIDDVVIIVKGKSAAKVGCVLAAHGPAARDEGGG
ncbi:hypothetical protein ACWER9_02760 [Micromonospora sp. NPDC003944]